MFGGRVASDVSERREPVRAAARASCWPRGVLVALAFSTACSGGAAPPPPIQPPEWGFGLTEPETLLEFRRYPAGPPPVWCRHPDTLLEQLDLAIAEGGGDLGRGCSAQVKDSFAAGRVLEITCPLRSVAGACVDTYRAIVWGNRYDNAPANYALYGFG